MERIAISRKELVRLRVLGGVLEGQLAPNDSGADLEYVREAYFDCDKHHFWVAERDDEVAHLLVNVHAAEAGEPVLENVDIQHAIR